jgi:hypothetical protein
MFENMFDIKNRMFDCFYKMIGKKDIPKPKNIISDKTFFQYVF